jgi:ADP-ribose pyrophosphatase
MSGETIFAGKLVTLVVADGKEIVRHPPAVAIVAVDRREQVVLVRQERPAVGGTVLEIPAGVLEAGERPVRAARRELKEETGLHRGEWAELAAIVTSPGFTDERIHLYVATGLEEGEPSPDAGEDLDVVRVKVADLPGLLPELEDAKTVAGLLLFLRR